MRDSDFNPRRILIVDDEPMVGRILERWLTEEGFQCRSVADTEEAAVQIASGSVDLVLCDVNLPGESGLEFLSTCRRMFDDEIVFVMISGIKTPATALEAINLGAHDYMTKPLDRGRVLLCVESALQRKRETTLRAHAIDRLGERLKRLDEESLVRLLWAAECRDDMTGAHIRRIGRCSAALAGALGWSPEATEEIRHAAALHDIGKIAVPDSILRKPGPLDFKEFEEMKQHTRRGAHILRDGSTSTIQMAASIALSHHENWDGSGYPDGLAGNDIPEAARIVAVVDVYDALVHDRPYRLAYSEHVVLRMMADLSGEKFEPRIYDVFRSILPTIRNIGRLLDDETRDGTGDWESLRRACEEASEPEQKRAKA